jgi:thiamine-phosphate pyrophosphorylase
MFSGTEIPSACSAGTPPTYQLAELRRRTSQTLVVIGGIHGGNAREVIAAGANGIAVVSAICGAPDAEDAARELRREIPR